jgi:hypothetical protein
MLTRKDINEFKSIGYYAIAMIIATREPSISSGIAVAIFIFMAILCHFRKD